MKFFLPSLAMPDRQNTYKLKDDGYKTETLGDAQALIVEDNDQKVV